jgi:PKD repeat protein
MNGFAKTNLKWFSGGVVAILATLLLLLSASNTLAQGGDTGSSWHKPYYPPPTSTPTPTPRPPTPTPTPTLQACQISGIIFDQDQYKVGETIRVTTRLADSRGTPLGGAKVTAIVDKQALSSQASTGFGFVDRIGEYDGVYPNTDVAGTYTFKMTASDPNGNRFLPCTASAVVQVAKAAPAVVAPSGVTINGPSQADVNQAVTFSAVVAPANATTPLIFAWTPQPASGQGTATATFTFGQAGDQTVSLTVSNAGGSKSASRTIKINPATPAGPLVTFDPLNLTIAPNGQGTSVVQVRNMNGLTAIQFEVVFNPAVVQVTDADPGTSGTQVKLSGMFATTNALVVRNEVVNDRIFFAAALLAPNKIDGNGNVVEIGWRATGSGNSQLRLENSQLIGADGQTPINAQTQNSTVTIGSASSGISGFVTLQGRRTFGGVLVTSDSGAQAQTDANGFFALASGQSFTAAFPGYLSAQASGGNLQSAAGVGKIILLAGDVNQDNVVNILDLAYMARHYHSNDSRADLNGDGRVDILDIAMAAENYGKAGPLTNWQ